MEMSWPGERLPGNQSDRITPLRNAPDTVLSQGVSAAAGHTARSVPTPFDRGRQGIKHLRCLILEDDAEQAQLLSRALVGTREFTFEIAHFEKPDDAVACMNAETFDLALVDQTLPDRYGTDIISTFGGRDAPVPFILLSASDDETHGDRAALEAGAYDFINKQDLSPRVMAHAVRFALDRFVYERRLRQQKRATRRARAEAERANQAKDRFLTAMSHELRTPLNAILGFSDVLKEERFGPLGDSHYKEYAADIHSSGSDLLKRLTEVLEFARIAQSEPCLNEEVTDLAELIKEIVAFCRENRLASHINLTVSVPDEGLCLLADDGLVRKMIMNLLSNAFRYTPAGGDVEVSARLEDDGIWLTVTDNGVGIAEKYVSQLHEPFSPLRPECHAASTCGWGLGLATVKHLMRGHGGQIKIDSVWGCGTTVHLRFPRERLVTEGGEA